MDSATITTSNNDPDIEAASVSSSGSSRSSRSSSSASNSPSVASTFPVDFTSPTVLAAFYGGGIAIIIFLTSSLLCCLNRRRKKIKHKSFAQDQKHREFDEVDVGSSVISQGNRHSLYETNHSGGNNQYSYQEQPQYHYNAPPMVSPPPVQQDYNRRSNPALESWKPESGQIQHHPQYASPSSSHDQQYQEYGQHQAKFHGNSDHSNAGPDWKLSTGDVRHVIPPALQQQQPIAAQSQKTKESSWNIEPDQAFFSTARDKSNRAFNESISKPILNRPSIRNVIEADTANSSLQNRSPINGTNSLLQRNASMASKVRNIEDSGIGAEAKNSPPRYSSVVHAVAEQEHPLTPRQRQSRMQESSQQSHLRWKYAEEGTVYGMAVSADETMETDKNTARVHEFRNQAPRSVHHEATVFGVASEQIPPTTSRTDTYGSPISNDRNPAATLRNGIRPDNQYLPSTASMSMNLTPMPDRIMPGMNMGYIPNGTIRSSRLNQNNVMSQPFANAVVPQGFAGYPGMGPTVMLDLRLAHAGQPMLPYTPYAMAMPGWQGQPTWLESPSGYVDQDGNPIPVMMIMPPVVLDPIYNQEPMPNNYYEQRQNISPEFEEIFDENNSMRHGGEEVVVMNTEKDMVQRKANERNYECAVAYSRDRNTNVLAITAGSAHVSSPKNIQSTSLQNINITQPASAIKTVDAPAPIDMAEELDEVLNTLMAQTETLSSPSQKKYISSILAFVINSFIGNQS
jgi:hypothetical protein